MRKTKFFIATLLVVAAASVAVVSCKKENPNTLLNNTSQNVERFTPPQVADMNAYLKDFKAKMQNVTRDGDETLSLEEAAWHLSSVANYDFANVNVNYTDLRYDTICYQMSITNGRVSLSNLNAIYQNMASDIDMFYQNLDLEEKHFRFIGVSISEDGHVEVALIISYILQNHTWYYGDDYLLAVACDTLFDENTNYVWNTTAIGQLEYAINIVAGHEYILPGESSTSRIYYVYTMDVMFDYDDYTDPYGSLFYGNSRIYSVLGDTYSTPTLSFNMMCYCFDSYLGLPFEYLYAHYNMGDQHPIHWGIEGNQYEFPEQNKWDLFYHIITVKLGRMVVTNDNPIND